MKTEFLKGLGLSDEDVQKILAENGKDIEREKAKTASALEKVETLETDKQSLEGQISELSEKSSTAEEYKAQLEKLQKEIKDKEEADKAAAEDAALTEAIMQVIQNRQFTSDYVKNGIIADMKTEIAKPENKGKGYAELFESLTKDKEGIFENPNKPANMTGMGPIDGNVSENAMRAVMGLAPNKE